MRATLAIGIVAGLSGCGSDPSASQSATKECSVKVAQLAAKQEMIPILRKIVDPGTRDRGCMELDGMLKDSSALYHFEEFRPSDCEWDYGDNGAYRQAYNIMERHQKSLAKLCDWGRKDVELRLEREGKEILQALTPEERQKVEQAYEGF